MTLNELKLIQNLLTIYSDARLHKTYEQACFIINREINLRTMDPRKGKD